MCSKRGRFELPHEILATEVLPRLPAKSLLRFKSVCKAWRDLISDPGFIESQLLKQQSQAASISNDGTIISANQQLNVLIGCFGEFHSIVVGSGDTTATKPHFNHFPLRVSGDIFNPRLWGSCNGLICIQIERRGEFGIWNPCIQSYRSLPHIPHGEHISGMPIPITFGFGYDAKIKDYKVVGIRDTLKVIPLVLEVQVFTLGANSWKRISDTNHWFEGKQGLFVNGSLIWNVRYNKLIRFDVHDEVFSEIKLPEGVLVAYDTMVHIGELGGCLVLVRELRSDSDVSHEVWVMKENWVKMYSINMSRSLCVKFRIPIIPIGSISISKKKEKKNHVEIVYVSRNGRLFSYNLNTKRFRRFRVHGGSNLKTISILTYVESLVSLGQ
ncbi:hypothetical protein Sjap_007632 [Stephania japonica]|uniref:F-box domain-containing protein n=1 Tax=Stephania japonica TaxID=461633 RepID=A0AAP0JN08_9MAGN